MIKRKVSVLGVGCASAAVSNFFVFADETICDTDFDHNRYVESNDSKRQGQESCSIRDKLEGPIETEEVKERACDSLIMCIVTTMNQGLRNGGGIGDILRAPSSNVSFLHSFFQ